jgi:hypothetical protein
MTRIHKALTLEKHNVTEVFVSREYLDKLGILELVREAVKTDNFAGVYERLIEDALEADDTNLVKIVTGEHIISVNEDGITFEAVPSINAPASPK